MKVSELISDLVAGPCSKLAFASVGDMVTNPGSPTAAQTLNRNKFIRYINLANLAIHKRFHLLKKTFELDAPIDEEEFTLPSNFLVPIHAYYADTREELNIRDDSTKLVDEVDTTVTLLMPEPFKIVIKGVDQTVPVHDLIIIKYAAAPVKATTVFNTISVNEVYREALLNYASYQAHSSISGDIKDENNTYYLRYEASCKQIVQSGMWGNNEISINLKLEENGFV
jgi:hypothetical protein